MKVSATYRTWVIAAGAFIFSIGAIFSEFSSGPTSSNVDYTRKEFVEFLNKKKQTGTQLCENFLKIPAGELWLTDHFIPEGWEVQVIGGSGRRLYWSDNQTGFDSAMLDTGAQVLYSEAGWNFTVSARSGSVTVCAIYPLMRTGKGSVPGYTRLDHVPGLQVELTLKSDPDIQIEQYRTGLQLTNQGETVWNINYFFWIGAVLIFIGLLLSGSTTFLWRIMIIALVVLFRVLLYKDVIYHAIRSTRVFDPGIYASSFLLPSLGDLTIHILCSIVVILHLGWIIKDLQFTKKTVLLLLLWAVLTGTLFLADMMHSIIKGLVLDSHISFDITNLSQINSFSLLSVTLISISLVAIYYFLHLTLKGKSFSPLAWVVAFALASAGFMLFQIIDGHARLATLIPSVALVGAYIAGLNLKQKRFWATSLVLAIAASVFVTNAIQNNIVKKEKEFLKIYAFKLVANKDLDAENRFLEVEEDLVAEFLKPEDFENFTDKKDLFEKRLRRLYFSGHLDRYDLKILNYDSLGNDLDEANFISYDILNHLYNDHSYPTLSSYFYQIKDPSLQSSFVAKFENCDINGHYGNVFLLLQPKLIQTSYTYPSLLKRKMENSFMDLEEHSYAIYSNNRLLQQRGNFPYPMGYTASAFNNRALFSGYSHFKIEFSKQSVVVLSHPNRNLLVYTSGFTFYLLFNLVFLSTGLVVILFLKRRHLRRLKKNSPKEEYEVYKTGYDRFISYWGFEQPLLSTRIQLAMIAVVFAGLLISVYFTIKYVEYNYNHRIEKELVFNLKEVSNHLQNEVNTELKISDPDSRLQLINQISNIYKIEANLFGPDGQLLATSGPELYNEGVLASVLDHEAYKELIIKGTSQLIHSEWIRDLPYLSAYVPVLNEKRQVIAYLNLPYFTKQKELEKEISAYTVTLVNVYALLFLFAMVLAYIVSGRITKPLKLIREKIAITTLGNKNEMLEWKRNDEIGQLIRQYNKMVLELGESARKLSASEREGAWKEMARQVAHEIKNPLTPMKLNIQHLQRAWQDEHPGLPATFERVTKVLIEQIDSLSRLAGEFSSFAQMPQNEFKVCPVNKVLTSTVHLFEMSENVTFESSIPEADAMVYADEEQLARAFNNVIKNAIQAIPDDRSGRIDIGMTVDDDCVIITIADNGPGIPPEMQKKIFSPNFSTKSSGMGLGLAISKKIIETSGGSIGFTTVEGKGTTFTIELPVYKTV